MTKPGQSPEEAAENADTFIDNHVERAQEYLKRGSFHTSLFNFGEAFHTVSDMTSPAHEGYQVGAGLGRLCTGIPKGVLAPSGWDLRLVQLLSSTGIRTDQKR